MPTLKGLEKLCKNLQDWDRELSKRQNLTDHARNLDPPDYNKLQTQITALHNAHSNFDYFLANINNFRANNEEWISSNPDAQTLIDNTTAVLHNIPHEDVEEEMPEEALSSEKLDELTMLCEYLEGWDAELTEQKYQLLNYQTSGSFDATQITRVNDAIKTAQDTLESISERLTDFTDQNQKWINENPDAQKLISDTNSRVDNIEVRESEEKHDESSPESPRGPRM